VVGHISTTMNNYYQQGLAKAQAKDYQGAIEDFQMALIANPAAAEVYYRRGLVYFDLGDHFRAISDYTQSIELQPQQREAYYGRSLVRLILKNLSGALADINQAILFGRDWAPAYQLKGSICQKLAQRPESIEAYKLAASLYLKQQDLANSRSCLEKAEAWNTPSQNPQNQININSNPAVVQASAIPLYGAAIAKAEGGDVAGALRAADGAVRSNPQDAQAYCCRGVIHLMSQNHDAALLDFNTALRLDPQGHSAYRHRGRMRQQLGDFQGALADFAQALQINPEDAQIHIFCSQVQASLGNYQQSIADLNQAIAVNPQDAAAYVERAQAHAKIEELTAAMADYQTAANMYLDQHNLRSYQETIAKLQSLQTNHASKPQPPSTGATSPPLGNGNSPESLYQRDLRQRLLVLVGGQWPMAERLIARYQEEYPGYDEEWYLEQVIAYIEQGL
jgi:tetratricopeptide (TPR) repeat protein